MSTTTCTDQQSPDYDLMRILLRYETEVLKEMRWGKWEPFAFNYADYSIPTFELPSF